ncbi:MAG: amidase [Gammaproteobacteria bacterium]|nr:amidase [Gammaproteobacteria bacterium]
MTESSSTTLGHAAAELASGRTTSRALVEECLARIDDPRGEGARTFLRVDAAAARTAADHVDAARRRGTALPRYAGIPISVKDLFDVAGETTTAGSIVLKDAAPATRDATVVARLRAAGFLLIGRTNMTEFAYSGLGVNPHYGTPRNPWDRPSHRIPGGSSSGAAVSVADRMAFAGIGTDTGGSCRIPAAFCGLVGFKPTAHRIPRDGVYPLSVTLDSVGPITTTVACCAAIDAVLAGEPDEPLVAPPIDRLRFAVPEAHVLADLSAPVAAAFERALQRTSARGARIERIRIPMIDEIPDLNRAGGFSAPEAFAEHRRRLAVDAARYDPRVLTRILRGRDMSAADYLELHRRRHELIANLRPVLAPYDALLMPTVPIVAPPLDALAADEDYARINAQALRNTSIVNFIDGCAISLPCHDPGEPPVGLSLFASGNTDRRVLAAAASLEAERTSR